MAKSSPFGSDSDKRPRADELEFKDLTPEQEPPPASGASAAPTAPQTNEPLQIDWFEEDGSRQEGRLFAEPAPEIPPQPFEIIREPRPAKASPSSAKPAVPIQASQAQSAVPTGPRPTATTRRPPLWVRLIWGLMPLLVMIGGYGTVITTQGKVGYAWDEAYYYEPAQDAADWLLEVVRGDRPFDAQSIDKYWNRRHEHPSVQKFLSGIAIRLYKDPRQHLFAMRLPIALTFGLTLTLLYMIGRRAYGTVAGLVTVLIYASMPRIFGHAHFACMETPLIFTMMLVVFCFLRGLDSPFWAAMTGISLGVALATKMNAFFLPPALVLWGQLYARKRYVNNLFAMLTLAPLTMIALWPWLWHDTLAKMLNYFAFHLSHQMTGLWFEGKIWGGSNPSAPWYYPLTMIGVTLPLTTLVLVVLGTARTLLAPHRRPYGSLFVICAGVMLAVASAPSTPRYDGVRLFLPVFPFLALLGGKGFVAVMRWIERLRGQANAASGNRRFERWVAAGIALAIVAEGGSACARYYPYMLSYFNPLVGGLPGAFARGYETTYWGEGLNIDVWDELSHLPDGSRIKPLAMHEKCLTDLQTWGYLNPTLRIGGPPPYDYHLLLFREGFFARPEWALAVGKPFAPLKVWKKMNVPILGLYKTGPAFEQYWTQLPPAVPRK